MESTPAVHQRVACLSRHSFRRFEEIFFRWSEGRAHQRVVLDGRRVVSQEALLQGKYGRIRDVAEGPDGAIYFSTSNKDGRGKPARDDDRIIRLTPVK